MSGNGLRRDSSDGRTLDEETVIAMGLGRGVVGASSFDVTAMPLSCLSLIPVKYLAALSRASRKRRDMIPGGDGWEEVADEFIRLVGIAGELLSLFKELS